jgi:hypothetical protein
MTRFLSLLALLSASLFGQAIQQVHPNPDCQIYFTLTSSGAFSPVQDNRQNGCSTWSIVYSNSGFSAVSLTLQSAGNNAGVPGAYSSGFPAQQSIITGSNPQTSTTGGYLWVIGINAWVRVSLTATGSGVVTGCLFGWRIPNAGQ